VVYFKIPSRHLLEGLGKEKRNIWLEQSNSRPEFERALSQTQVRSVLLEPTFCAKNSAVLSTTCRVGVGERHTVYYCKGAIFADLVMYFEVFTWTGGVLDCSFTCSKATVRWIPIFGSTWCLHFQVSWFPPHSPDKCNERLKKTWTFLPPCSFLLISWTLYVTGRSWVLLPVLSSPLSHLSNLEHPQILRLKWQVQ
jgi:hypothetical protein